MNTYYIAKATWNNGMLALKILIHHPMEDGRRIDHETGELVPANYISDLWLTRYNEELLHMAITPQLCANPYFSLSLADIDYGDVIQVGWQTNRYERNSFDVVADYDYQVRTNEYE